MEFLSEISVWIMSALGGVSLSAIISAIIYGCLKGAFNKTIAKINVQQIADLATEKGVERVKKVSFTHSIQPLVESELEKINEKSVEVLKKELADVKEKYDNVINILDKLACYFDNSIGVGEDKKADLKKAVAEATDSRRFAECIVVEELAEETKTAEKHTPNQAKTTTKVER